MEEFLSSNGVQYEHHDIATDAPARQDLEQRGIKAAPVTIIDGREVIIGYYPKKLIPALNLNVAIDLSGKTGWLADKYDKILGATMRATQQMSPEQLLQQVPWRPERVRDTIVHILSFPELAWRSHEHGSMSTEDMRACRERLQHIMTSEEIIAYGDGVRQDIIKFLNSNNTEGFDRVVPAHYGGEVTVVELLNIILSHSTHHLKQVYWFMETELGLAPVKPASPEDMEGIFTPEALI
ncbi:MAG: DinB family protein [Dehalococcoidia bacterium]